MIKWVLGVIVLGLGGLLYLQWSGWPPPAVVQRAQAVPGATQVATEPDPLVELSPLEDLEEYAAIKDRPLFRPDRRPRVDEPEEETAPPPPEETAKLDGLDLAGVLISPGVTVAWVKDPTQPAPLRVRPGEELNGWTVKDIKTDRLVLERQGTTDTLPLRTFNAPWASPPPPPLPPRAAAKQAPPGKPQEGEDSAKPAKPAAPSRPPSPSAKQRTVNPQLIGRKTRPPAGNPN